MNIALKTYLLVAMLSMSTLALGVGDVVGTADAQSTLDAVDDAASGVDDCVAGLTAPADPAGCEAIVGEVVGGDPYGLVTAVEDDADDLPDPEEIVENQIPDKGDNCPEDATTCVPLEGSGAVLGAIGSAIASLPGPFNGDGAPLFPDEGGDGDLQLVIPNATTGILGYQDSDGDGDSDYEELTGCGTGRPINPHNAKANCDNYDGDAAPNDIDPKPYDPTKLAISLVGGSDFVAPVTGDQLKFTYQCLGDLDLSFTVSHDVDNSASWQAPRMSDANPDAVADPDVGSHECSETGNITVDPNFLVEVFDDPGFHGSVELDIRLQGADSQGTLFTSNKIDLTVTNAAETGVWRPICITNMTSVYNAGDQVVGTEYDNGYCGNPGDNHDLHGVRVTYDDNGFPDKHPHPGSTVVYDVVWEFTHTSYASGEKQNITRIEIEAGAGDRYIEPSYYTGNPADSDAATYYFTGDAEDDQKYYVGPTQERNNLPKNPVHVATRLLDEGGGFTSWGDYCQPADIFFCILANANDDHGQLTSSAPLFSHLNDIPELTHNNETEEYVGYDHTESVLSLRVRGQDNGPYARTGHGGDEVNVKLHYYSSPDGSEPTSKGQFKVIENLETAPQSCAPGVLDLYGVSDTFDNDIWGGEFIALEKEHRNSGLPLQCDYWRSDVNGNSNGGGEIYQVNLDVPEGSTLYYWFSAEDASSSGDGEAETDEYVYIVGELPLDEDPERADTIGAELDSLVDDYKAVTGIADDGIAALTGSGTDRGDPFDTDEDGKTNEPNGQVDLVEQFVVVFDEDSINAGDANDDFDGDAGTTAYMGSVSPTSFQSQSPLVIRVGDAASTADQNEAAIVSYGGFGVICAIEEAGHPVRVYANVLAGFNPDSDAPCGAPVDEGTPYAIVVIDNKDYFGFIVYEDADGDGERLHAEGRSANPLAGSPEDAFGVYITKPPTGPGDVHVIDGPRQPIDREIPTTVEDITFSDVDIDRYTVSWSEASDDVGVDHYSVYTSNATISDLDKATVTNVTDATTLAFEGVDLGSVQYVVVTAVDAQGKESHLSKVASVDLPDPAIVLSETQLTVEEGGESFQYTINVNDLPKPNKKIAIDLEVIDNSEFLADPITVDLERIELNAADYEAGGLFVNISFPDDDFGMGDRTYIVRHSVDPTKVGHDLRFDGASDADLTVTVREDDIEPAINLANEAGLETEEGSGDNLTFEVSLSRRPTDDVFVHVSLSNDTRLRQTTPHYLLFGIHDWDEPKEVTLTAPDNDRVDGDKKIQVLLEIDTEDSAIEFIERAPSRQIIVSVEDDEIDTDEDGILDSLDDDPNDRFDEDYRPSEFEYEMSSDGSAIRFTWTAEHLDERIDRYIIWQFSEPTNVGEIEVIDGQREYNATIAFGGGVHDFALQPVLERDNGEYDEEAAVPLGSKVFTPQYFAEVCGTGNDTEEDSDGDGICDAFEEELGTDPDEADSDGDGRTDHQEVFLDSTSASDPESHYTVIPAWGTNPWMIIGGVLVLASIVLAIVSMVQQSRARSRRSNAVRS